MELSAASTRRREAASDLLPRAPALPALRRETPAQAQAEVDGETEEVALRKSGLACRFILAR